MPSKLQEAVQSVLGKFDSATETFLEVAIADALRPLPAEIPASSQVDRDFWWAESAAMRFYRRADGEASVWGTTYGPMMSTTGDDGRPFYSPDIAEANTETIEYWKRRRDEAKHPILRARYSDLVWVSHVLLPSKSRTFRLPRLLLMRT